MFEPERRDRDTHGPLADALGEPVGDPVTQLMDIQLGCVDDGIGEVAQVGQPFPFGDDRVGERSFTERVGTPVLFVPLDDLGSSETLWWPTADGISSGGRLSMTV